MANPAQNGWPRPVSPIANLTNQPDSGDIPGITEEDLRECFHAMHLSGRPRMIGTTGRHRSTLFDINSDKSPHYV
jgi:hypothetical protein